MLIGRLNLRNDVLPFSDIKNKETLLLLMEKIFLISKVSGQDIESCIVDGSNKNNCPLDSFLYRLDENFGDKHEEKGLPTETLASLTAVLKILSNSLADIPLPANQLEEDVRDALKTPALFAFPQLSDRVFAALWQYGRKHLVDDVLKVVEKKSEAAGCPKWIDGAGYILSLQGRAKSALALSGLCRKQNIREQWLRRWAVGAYSMEDAETARELIAAVLGKETAFHDKPSLQEAHLLLELGTKLDVIPDLPSIQTPDELRSALPDLVRLGRNVRNSGDLEHVAQLNAGIAKLQAYLLSNRTPPDFKQISGMADLALIWIALGKSENAIALQQSLENQDEADDISSIEVRIASRIGVARILGALEKNDGRLFPTYDLLNGGPPLRPDVAAAVTRDYVDEAERTIAEDHLGFSRAVALAYFTIAANPTWGERDYQQHSLALQLVGAGQWRTARVWDERTSRNEFTLETYAKIVDGFIRGSRKNDSKIMRAERELANFQPVSLDELR
jgi:hypothetical protein